MLLFFVFFSLFFYFYFFSLFFDVDRLAVISIVFFFDFTTPHSIRIVARLFEPDKTESGKTIIRSVVCRIEKKCGNGDGF